MASLDAAERAVSNPGLRENILNGIRNPESGISEPGNGNSESGYGTIRKSTVWKIAAAILLLVSLNVFTMVYYGKSPGTSQSATKSVASEYFSYIDNYNL